MASRAAAEAKIEEASSRRRERMRLILIEAATRLFAKKGVDATTIDEIVDLAGVAKGTFYNYFTDRPDIAHAVAATMRHEMNAAVEELNTGIDDPAERVSRGVRLFLALVARDPVRARMLARIYEGGSNIASHGNKHLIGDLMAGIEQGRIRVPSLDVALHLVVSLGTIGMRHLVDVGAGDEILRGEGYAHDLAAILLQGLGVRAPDIERILKRPFDVSHIGIWK
jgi:AcrR family transcriptional regulator